MQGQNLSKSNMCGTPLCIPLFASSRRDTARILYKESRTDPVSFFLSLTVSPRWDHYSAFLLLSLTVYPSWVLQSSGFLITLPPTPLSLRTPLFTLLSCTYSELYLFRDQFNWPIWAGPRAAQIRSFLSIVALSHAQEIIGCRCNTIYPLRESQRVTMRDN